MKYVEENNARTRVHNIIYIKSDLHVFHINYKVVTRSYVRQLVDVHRLSDALATADDYRRGVHVCVCEARVLCRIASMLHGGQEPDNCAAAAFAIFPSSSSIRLIRIESATVIHVQPPLLPPRSFFSLSLCSGRVFHSRTHRARRPMNDFELHLLHF